MFPTSRQGSSWPVLWLSGKDFLQIKPPKASTSELLASPVIPPPSLPEARSFHPFVHHWDANNAGFNSLVLEKEPSQLLLQTCSPASLVNLHPQTPSQRESTSRKPLEEALKIWQHFCLFCEYYVGYYILCFPQGLDFKCRRGSMGLARKGSQRAGSPPWPGKLLRGREEEAWVPAACGDR